MHIPHHAETNNLSSRVIQEGNPPGKIVCPVRIDFRKGTAIIRDVSHLPGYVHYCASNVGINPTRGVQ